MRVRGYDEYYCRECAHAAIHLGRVLQETQGEVVARHLDELIVEESATFRELIHQFGASLRHIDCVGLRGLPLH